MSEFQPKEDPNHQNPHRQTDQSPQNNQPIRHGIQPRQMGRTMGRTMGRSMNRFDPPSEPAVEHTKTEQPETLPIKNEEPTDSTHKSPESKENEKDATINNNFSNENRLRSIKEMPALRIIPEIQESVGAGGVNNKPDVEVVEYYLQMLEMLPEMDAIPQDAGAVLDEAQLPKLIAALFTFQEEVLHWQKTDGNIGGPVSKTMMALKTFTARKAKPQMEIYPAIKAKREAEAAAKAKAEEEAKKKEADKVAGLTATRAAEKKEQGRIENLKAEASDETNVARKLQGLTINKEIVAFLQDYVFHNPEFVIQAIKHNSGSIFNENTDDLSFSLLNKIGKSKIANIDKKLLKYFYDTLDWGWTSDEELEWMKAISGMLGDNVQDENLTSDVKLDELMKKERLTPEEIHEARGYIKNLNNDLQKLYFAKLQTKVKYKNQRNNESIATESDIARNSSWLKSGNKVGDIMCNVTSLAMSLNYLGISNPSKSMQFEDYLEFQRRENNLGSRTSAKTWASIAKLYNVATDLTDISSSDQEIIRNKLQKHLDSGSAVIISVFSSNSGKGHIVRLQSIQEKGIIVDDPYGDVSEYLGDRESGKSGYKEKENYDQRNKRNSEEGVGEDNLWTWQELNKTVIKYGIIFKN